jgi:hypothetical protein
VPADPAEAAVTNPILIVGGHGTTEPTLQGWAAHINSEVVEPEDPVIGVVPLRSAPFLWPGTESNEKSAYDPASSADVYDAIVGLANEPGERVEVIAASQGALVVRRLMQLNPNDVRSKVASVISFGGVNGGINDFNTALDACDPGGFSLVVCEEMVWEDNGNPSVDPGNTTWLRTRVNMAPSGDPTPGNIRYYHIYTINDDTTSTPIPDYMGQELEALQPYGWQSPLPGAVTRAAQDDCGTSHVAPHTGWDGTNPDEVQHELLADALYERPLDAPADLC